MEKNILEYVGKSLYKTHILKEMKRYVVFRARCAMHSSKVDELLQFLMLTAIVRLGCREHLRFWNRPPERFFTKAQPDERVESVQNHLLIMEELFKPELMDKLYSKGEMVQLWEDSYDDRPLTLQLWFHAGQRKEGCMSLALFYEGEPLYQIMFWPAKIKQTARMLFISVPCRDRRTVMS